MLDMLKTIIYISNQEQYKEFLDIAASKCKNSFIISDISLITETLNEFDQNDITVVFLDSSLMNKLSEDALALLKSKRVICIMLSKNYPNRINEEAYIYDWLVCIHPVLINNFFIRLEKDLKYRQEHHYFEKKIKKFDDISLKLTSEKNINVLLDLIINSCMELTYAEAGTIYVVLDHDTNEWSYYEKELQNKCLQFVLAKNKILKLDLEQRLLPITRNSINGFTVLTGKSLRLDDVYNIPTDAPYKFDASFDRITGYKTQSMLNVPMKDHYGRILGVIQLINKKDASHSISFDNTDELLVSTLAGLAAVSLENAFLHRSKEKLLEDYRQTMQQEIIKRKKADSEVNKLLSAIESNPVSVVITDINGKIEYVNPKFTQISGYTRNELIGRNIRAFETVEHTEEFYNHFWESITAGKDWFGEFQNERRNGELYWEHVSVSAIKDECHRIKYFIFVKEDVTEKKSMIQAIENKNIELQATIDKLNHAQSQLVQKEKMAAVGQLAAGIAHEINNPLGFMTSNHSTFNKYVYKLKGLIEEYRRLIINSPASIDTSTIKDYEEANSINFIMSDILELLNDNTDGFTRIGDIVNALRAFSHIDQIKSFTEYDINDGIRNTLTISNSKLRDTCIIVENKLQVLPLIKCNGGEINQVILNLLINAIDAITMKNSEGQGNIRFKTYAYDDYVSFEIEDDGIGMSQEIQGKIYEPFFTSKPIGKGTGLGLSISYDIVVKKHLGEMLCESVPGIGTKFIVKLPMKT